MKTPCNTEKHLIWRDCQFWLFCDRCVLALKKFKYNKNQINFYLKRKALFSTIGCELCSSCVLIGITGSGKEKLSPRYLRLFAPGLSSMFFAFSFFHSVQASKSPAEDSHGNWIYSPCTFKIVSEWNLYQIVRNQIYLSISSYLEIKLSPRPMQLHNCRNEISYICFIECVTVEL